MLPGAKQESPNGYGRWGCWGQSQSHWLLWVSVELTHSMAGGRLAMFALA